MMLHFLKNLAAKKPIGVLLAEPEEPRSGSPVFTAVGAMIGAGVFVLAGPAAAYYAGPGVIWSFLLAAAVCALVTLCYAELASTVPVTASPYAHVYAASGEISAWLVAWSFTAARILGVGVAAAGCSAYLQQLLDGFGMTVPRLWSRPPYTPTPDGGAFSGAAMDLPALILVSVLSILLVSGVRQRSRVGRLVLALQLFVLANVLVLAAAHGRPELWRTAGALPLVPYAAGDPAGPGPALVRVATAAALLIFAYLGFEQAVRQEGPSRRSRPPTAALVAIGLCAAAFTSASAALTALAPFSGLDAPAPFAAALADAPVARWLHQLLRLAIVVGLAWTVLTLLGAQAQSFYALTRDRLLPAGFGRVDPRTRALPPGTTTTSILGTLAAAFFPVMVLAQAASAAALLAFALICAGTIWLRLRHPDLPRGFRMPLWFVTAPLGLLGCLGLIATLWSETWKPLGVWMLLGLIVYLAYGYWRSPHHRGRPPRRRAA